MTEFWRDPALPFVESRRTSDSRACYRPHSHPTLSIGAVDAGRSRFQCGGVQAPLAAGSLVTVPAGLVHACNPLPALSWSYQMLHLDHDWVGALLADMGRGDELPREAFVSQAPVNYRAFCRLNALLFSGAPAADKETALIEFLGRRLWCGGQPLAFVPEPATFLEPLKARLLASLDAPPSLTELAREYGISRYQLIRQFRRETGLTPHAWMLDQRVQQARRRLRQGAELASLAQDLGFADQGHFQRVFKAHVAVTPGRYRRT